MTVPMPASGVQYCFDPEYDERQLCGCEGNTKDVMCNNDTCKNEVCGRSNCFWKRLGHRCGNDQPYHAMIHGKYKLETMVDTWVYIADSPTGAGLGCFAAKDLPDNFFLGFYAGELISNRQARDRYLQGTRIVGGEYLMQYNPKDNILVDARVYGNHTRFVNHSCEPNCSYEKTWWPGDGVWLAGTFDKVYDSEQFDMPGLSADYKGADVHMIEMRTMREIRKGEELTCNYMGGKAAWIKDHCMCLKCRPLHE